MIARSVNAAADVIIRAMENGRQTPAGWAMALDDVCMLQTPETAAELVQLRERVAELEQQLAAKDRTVDEDPIAYALTDTALSFVGCDECGTADLCAPAKSCARLKRPRVDVRPQVRKLRALLAGQRDAVAGERP